MRDIYLIDFENVASEGLSGITYLSPEDQVIIFYSTNSNRLSMKMHILIGKSVCKLSYFEVSVGGKNALDHQISTWLGYLIGVNAAERSYYIVSRDMGYRHVANFWAVNDGKPRVKCVETIRAAVRLERIRQEKGVHEVEQPQDVQPQDPTVPVPVQAPAALLAVAEPVLALKAAENQVPQAQEAQETVERQVEVTVEVSASAEPLESLEEPEPGRKSYRGRTRFRRNRTRGHSENSHGKPENRENVKPEPEAAEKPQNEAPKAPKPEIKPEPQPKAEAKPEVKPQPKTEAKPEPKVNQDKPQEKKPVHTERYNTSFWQKPREEIKRSQPKTEAKTEAKPQPKAESKSEAKSQPKAEPKNEPKPQPKAEAKPEAKADQPKNEPKPEAKADQPKNEPKLEAQANQPKAEAKAEPEKKPEHAEAKEKPQGRQKRAPRGDKPKKAPAAKQEAHDLTQLTRLIAPYPELQEAALRELVLANKRQVLCNTLRKQLGQEKGLALYNELKKSVWK